MVEELLERGPVEILAGEPSSARISPSARSLASA